MNKINDDRWVAPTPAGEKGSILTATQVNNWQTEGFAFVNDILPPELITDLQAYAANKFPKAGSEAANEYNNFGSNLVFPNDCEALTDITLHPRLLSAVAQLLEVPINELRLAQSDVWPKYGRQDKSAGQYDHSDQRIHVDYPNHMLTHPTEWHRPEAVEIIIYYSDVDTCMGPTAVVPRQGDEDPAYPWPIVDSPGIAGKPYINDRASAEADMATRDPKAAQFRETLYNRELYTQFHPGDVLLYRHDTWHRGTPMIDGAYRLVHNLTYRRADCEWISTLHIGWAWSAYRTPGFLEKLIARASLDQRAVLGFPQPGSRYWSEATIEAIQARHVGIDMSPYRKLLAKTET
ncbi:MAG: hypothetical protein ACI9ON_001757 [Limisphaerales bacterium]